jgi:hypothetical protein
MFYFSALQIIYYLQSNQFNVDYVVLPRKHCITLLTIARKNIQRQKARELKKVMYK